ncbi:MAG: MFS transporter [Gammaproteobacteria bacterium]|nr:MFS transporter [Gammaproteobacteria bacterium]MCP5458010.1 MFS transporter [Gammaproteobacteria bacterium]
MSSFPFFSLLLGAAILFTGNGLQGVLIPVRASLENFSTGIIGLIATAYSVGFVISCYWAPHIVKRVGHIRTFAVLAAIAASTVLLLVLLPNPFLWIALRVVNGFCLAGLFMVIESWLNEKSTNINRGRVFSVYMVVNLGTVTAGQLLLPTADPGGFTLFAVTCIAITLALVPVGLTKSATPAPLEQVRLRVGYLYGVSPVGVMGSFFVGAANGAYLGLGPLYAQAAGLSLSGIALFMSATMLGGAVAQFPLGKLSDRVDRRWVITGLCFAASTAGAALALAGGLIGPWPTGAWAFAPTSLIGLAGIFGCFTFTLYSLCVAHVNDHVASEEFVEASGGLLLTYGIGASIGPLVAAWAMQTFNSGGLFAFTAGVHLAFCLFTLYRITQRAPATEEERGPFVQLSANRVTPAIAALDPRAPEIAPSLGENGVSIQDGD